jgi:hypothetical protein
MLYICERFILRKGEIVRLSENIRGNSNITEGAIPVGISLGLSPFHAAILSFIDIMEGPTPLANRRLNVL